MKFKQIVLPLLLVSATLLWAFKPYNNAGKVIRTKGGAFIIPSSVKISPKDQQFILKNLKEANGVYAALAYKRDGELKTYGNYDLSIFRQVGKEIGESMEPSANSMVGFILFKKKISFSKVKDENKRSEESFVVERAYIGVGVQNSIGQNLDNVLSRYAD
ncbi:MAG: hypothetical protein KDD63_13140 [Bacteroidetes bacterium]|nr:hypothetical protein [Bacteroidota bacterium]MCB0853163.1 hypothetical protein [Bacteroidota bacterium]